jgi:L-lysine 2,3-aminomutase
MQRRARECMRSRTQQQKQKQQQKQRGQAGVEYLVVTAAIVYALFAYGDASIVNQLCAAFRSFYRAYGFALSLP